MVKGDLHLLIVGAGAMGCLFAAQLKRAGFQITLLEKVRETADRIGIEGITVEGVRGQYHVMVPAISDRPPHQPDLVVLCVKSYDTREAGETLRPWLQPDAPILTLQNGVGNIEVLQNLFGKQRVLGGVTAEGATVLGPGNIRHAGQGETIVGRGKATEDIVSVFEKAGFNIRAVDDIHPFIWGKLVVNAGINALAAVTRLKNGRLPELKGTRSVMEALVHEAVAVIKAKNIGIPYPDPVGRVVEVCKATGANVASMLQDVLNKKRTEIDSINGAVVREGAALGIPTPVNSTLTALVHTIEQTYREREMN